MDSSDEALCEMLGLLSLDAVTSDQEKTTSVWTVIHHLHMTPMTIMTEEDDTLGGEGRDHPTIQVKVDSLGLAKSASFRFLLCPSQDTESVGPTHSSNYGWTGVVGPNVRADRTYETIRILKKRTASLSRSLPKKEDDTTFILPTGTIEERLILTRLENFMNHHGDWRDLCHNHIRQYVCVPLAVVGEEMVLHKEKLHLKPPGGSGFAQHLDSPVVTSSTR